MKKKNSSLKLINLYITPSWLSGLIAITVAIATVAFIVIVVHVRDAHLQVDIINLGRHSSSQAALTLPGQTVQPVNSTLQNTWPLIIFWGFIGLFSYLAVETIARTYYDIKNFEAELHYVHAKSRAMIIDAIINLIVRLLALIGLLIFTNIFLKQLLTRAIADSYTAGHHLGNWQGIKHGLLALLLIILSLHLIAFLLRIFVGRPRIFTKSYYLS